MIKSVCGKTPRLHPEARIAENATVLGEVTAQAGVNIWYGAVVRADANFIRIGADTNIQDCAVVHNDDASPVTLGRGVTVGHGAIVHGCTVEDDCLIGMGAILLNGCVIGRESVVAAGALVKQNDIIPPRSMVMGTPAKVVRPLREDEVAFISVNCQEYVQLAQQLPAAGEDFPL
ncbi:MAG: gamma carbonic anhydrase family protein [Pseudoflavonifractor sp.]